MEPLIKLNFLVSRFNEDQLNQFMQKLLKSLGSKRIMKLITNDILRQFEDGNEFKEDLPNLIAIALKICTDKDLQEQQPPKKQENTERKVAIKIDTVPPEMIQECASFLVASDYMNLSITNRAIYCATNSPMTLRELNLMPLDVNVIDQIDMNRFKLLHSLYICPDN